MNFVVREEAAESMSREITSKGGRFASLSAKGVDGANTSGVKVADSLSSCAQTLISVMK